MWLSKKKPLLNCTMSQKSASLFWMLIVT